MRGKLSKKRLAAVAFIGVLAITGAAVAYFTGGSGTVTGSGTVGSSTPWGVATGTPTWSGTLTALYPGATSDTEFLPFTVTNNGNGHQCRRASPQRCWRTAAATLKPAPACPSPGASRAWFTAATDPGNPALADLAPGGTYTGKIDLTMQDTSTSQDLVPGQGARRHDQGVLAQTASAARRARHGGCRGTPGPPARTPRVHTRRSTRFPAGGRRRRRLIAACVCLLLAGIMPGAAQAYWTAAAASAIASGSVGTLPAPDDHRRDAGRGNRDPHVEPGERAGRRHRHLLRDARRRDRRRHVPEHRGGRDDRHHVH